MAWNNVPKPGVSDWDNVNPHGKEQYDQETLTYNDATTFYDGIVPDQWTGIAKPAGSAWTNVPKPI